MTHRVFSRPDGSVRIFHLNPQVYPSPTEADYVRESSKLPGLADLPFVDMDTTDLPVDRSQRHKWRVQAGKVAVDLSVPDPPHPRQTALDQLDAAVSVADLRQAMKDFITGT